MNAHPHPKRLPVRPFRRRQGQLDLRRCGNSVCGPTERNEERVALMIHLIAVMTVERSAKNSSMQFERRAVALWA